jgi:SAM-dependent methyltransferase
VLGIDLAPRMVERTAADFEATPQVEVRVADAFAPGLPASSFDVVGSSLVLFFRPDPAAAVRTWTELLVDGGRSGVTTFGARSERWKSADAVFAPYLPQALLDARTSGTRGPFASDDGVEELFRGTGLTDVRTAHREFEAVFRDAEHLVEFSWSHGQRVMWESVPADERPAVRERIVELAEGFGDEAGGFSFTQQVRYTLGRRPAA